MLTRFPASNAPGTLEGARRISLYGVTWEGDTLPVGSNVTA
jgi:hypothetical protein